MAITLTTLRVLFTADTRDLDRGFKYATTEAQRFTRNAVASAISLQQYLTYPLKALLDTQIAYRDLNERSLITFKQLLGNEVKAKQLIADLKDFAVKTPFEFKGLLDNTRLLNAFGVKGKELLPVIKSISDAVSGLGGTAETVDRVSLAFGKLKTEGKLNAGIMRQFTTAGIQAWQILADKIGVSIPALRAMTKDGIIPAQFAFDTLIVAMEERFPNFSEKFGNTFSAAFSNITDAATQLLDEILIPTLDRLKVIVVDVSNALLKFRDQVAKFSDEDKKLLGVLPIVIATMGAFALAIVIIPVVLSAVLSPLGLVTIGLGVYVYNIITSKEETEKFIATVQRNLVPALETLKLILQGIIIYNVFSFLFSGINVVVGALGALSIVGRGAITVFGIFNTSLRFMGRFLRAAWFSLYSIGQVIKLLIQGYQALTPAGLAAANGVADAATAMGTTLSTAVSGVSAAIGGLFAAILALALGAFEDYTHLGQSLLDSSNTRSQQIAVSMGKAFEVLKEIAINSISAIIVGFKILGGIMSVLTGIILVGSKLIYIAFQSLIHLFGITIGKLIEATGIFGGSFQSFADSFGKALQDMIGWTEASEKTRAAAKGLEDGVKSLSGAFGQLGSKLGIALPKTDKNLEALRAKTAEARKQYGLAINDYQKFKNQTVFRSSQNSIPVSQQSISVIAALGLKAERERQAYVKVNEQLKQAEKQVAKKAAKPTKDPFDDFKKSSEELLKKLKVANLDKYNDPLYKQKEKAQKAAERHAKAILDQRRTYIQTLDKKIFEARNGGKTSGTQFEVKSGIFKDASDETKRVVLHKQAVLASLEAQKKKAEEFRQATKRANDYMTGLQKNIVELKSGTKGLNVEWEISNGVLKNMSQHYKDVARQRAKQIEDLKREQRVEEEILNIRKQINEYDTGADNRTERQKFADSFSFGVRAEIPQKRKNYLITDFNAKSIEKERNNSAAQYIELMGKLNERLEDEDTFQGRVNKKLREELDARKELKANINPEQYINIRNAIEKQLANEDASKKRKEQLADYETEKKRLIEIVEKKEEYTQLEKYNADLKRGAYDTITKLQQAELKGLAINADASIKAKKAAEELTKQKEAELDITQKLNAELEEARSKFKIAQDGGDTDKKTDASFLEEYRDKLNELSGAKRQQVEQQIISTGKEKLSLDASANDWKEYYKAIREVNSAIEGLQARGSVAKARSEINKELEKANVDANRLGQKYIDFLVQQTLTKQKLEEQKKLYESFWTSVQGVFESAFKELFNKGFKGFFNKILQGFEELIEQMVAKWIGSQLFKLILGAFGGDTSLADNFRAVGGYVAQNEPYVVGERGAELFVPQQSGTIVPNSKLGSTGNTTINITVHAKDADSFRRSQSQVLSEAYKIMSEQQRRNG